MADYYNVRFIYKDGEKTTTKGLGTRTHWEDFEPALLDFIKNNDAQGYEKVGRALIHVEGEEKLTQNLIDKYEETYTYLRKLTTEDDFNRAFCREEECKFNIEIPYCYKELDYPEAIWTFDCINNELIYEEDDLRLSWPFAAKGGLKNRKNPFTDLKKVWEEKAWSCTLADLSMRIVTMSPGWKIVTGKLNKSWHNRMKKLGFVKSYDDSWSKEWEKFDEMKAFLKETKHEDLIKEIQLDRFLEQLSTKELVDYSNACLKKLGKSWMVAYGGETALGDYVMGEHQNCQTILIEDLDSVIHPSSLEDAFARIEPGIFRREYFALVHDEKLGNCAMICWMKPTQSILSMIERMDDPELKKVLSV